jgi:hypothetical protein
MQKRASVLIATNTVREFYHRAEKELNENAAGKEKLETFLE